MQQRRIESFLFDNAETRYLDFVKENPNLLNRVSLSYLASFLGIERQSLTRIRKKLAHHQPSLSTDHRLPTIPCTEGS